MKPTKTLLTVVAVLMWIGMIVVYVRRHFWPATGNAQQETQIAPAPTSAQPPPQARPPVPAPSPALLSSVEPDKTRWTGLAIAQKAMQFVESMQRKDGTYSFVVHCDNFQPPHCDQETNFSALMLAQSINPIISQAYMALFRATADKAYEEKAQRTAKSALQIYFSGLPANAPVPCPATFDMLPIIIDAYKTTKDPKYRRTMESCIERFSGNTDQFFKPPEKVLAHMPKAIRVSLMNEGVRRLQLAKFEVALLPFNGAKSIQDRAANDLKISLNSGNLTGPSACEVSSVAMDFYNATRNAQFLKEAQQVFDVKGLTQFPQDADALLSCADSAIGLFKATSEEQYKITAVTLLQALMSKYWDREGTQTPKVNGDNGFLAMTGRDKMTATAARAVVLFSAASSVDFKTNP